jgi:hypothetical protein
MQKIACKKNELSPNDLSNQIIIKFIKSRNEILYFFNNFIIDVHILGTYIINYKQTCNNVYICH